jgi:NADPH:quinone reductase-like Zn-dependent oxidoreductase
MVRSGAYPTPTPFPFVVGRDLVGLPVAVDAVAAVAVLHPAATAYLALYRHGVLRPGETVYVAGAAGNVGTALTSLAGLGGARVLAGARSEDAGWCRSAGAAEVVDYRDPDLSSGRWSAPSRPTRPSSAACAAGSCCGSPRPSPLDAITLAI